MKHFKLILTILLCGVLAITALCACGDSNKEFDYSDYGIQVSEIEGLSDDFIFGVDLSSIIEVENAGGKFYDEDGNETDIFELLASYGVNYVRIRLWNDPYDEDGNSFGGGGNDLETDIEIAKRAVAAGMQVCLDFHYSDFWADPSKQTIPREWEDYTSEELRQVIYDYTYSVLQAFDEAGCLPSMVQTGNEVNNGIMYPNGKTATYQAIYMSSAMSAVKDYDEDILTVVHLANGATYSSISGKLDELITAGVEFDVIGLSYYSYWHGSMSDFQDCVEKLAENYDQKICVMEYSYGYGDDSNEYTANIFSSDLEETGGYKATVQGQASYIHDVNEVIASVDTGIGTFYWEPAWLPLEGTSWATDYAHDYLEAQGDGGGEGTVSWANQALFDFDGNPLASLNAFKLMRDSGTAEENILEINTEISCMVDLSSSEEIALPETVTALTDLDRWVELDITWNEDEIAAIDGAGEYTVTGTVTCGGVDYDVTATVTTYYDYLKNGSFDDDTISADVKDFDNITGWSMTGTDNSYRVESKNARSGSNNLNIWCSSAFENTLSQEIYNLTAGTYTFSVYARSAMENYNYPECTLYVTVGDETYEAEITWGDTWSDWVQTTIEFTVTETTDITVGIKSTGEAATWAHFDDFALSRKD
ncbi:MAG: glycosyl hydrolase 53 family protein [Oscillospiraceae bacterium]|nr:glycosyl hydrolase 53 family protein [Oscillospiraceae bacterium]